MAGRTKKSTPEKRTLILWALLVQENAAAFQNELRPEPDKADRDALIYDGLVRSEKRGRQIWIEVTEKGWDWAGKNLDAALPKNSYAGALILQGWLTRIKAFMDARNFVLADMLGSQGSAQRRPTPPSAPAEYGTVRERIRKAYLALTGDCFNKRAFLRDIRDKLKEIDRQTLDEALKRMHLEEGTTLSGLNNPQEMTAAIHDAGLNFKGEPMYVLWITK